MRHNKTNENKQIGLKEPTPLVLKMLEALKNDDIRFILSQFTFEISAKSKFHCYIDFPENLQDGPPLISVAAYFGSSNCFTFLLSHLCTNAFPVDSSNRSVLFFVLKGKHFEFVPVLLQLGFTFGKMELFCLVESNDFHHFFLYQQKFRGIHREIFDNYSFEFILFSCHILPDKWTKKKYLIQLMSKLNDVYGGNFVMYRQFLARFPDVVNAIRKHRNILVAYSMLRLSPHYFYKVVFTPQEIMEELCTLDHILLLFEYVKVFPCSSIVEFVYQSKTLLMHSCLFNCSSLIEFLLRTRLFKEDFLDSDNHSHCWYLMKCNFSFDSIHEYLKTKLTSIESFANYQFCLSDEDRYLEFINYWDYSLKNSNNQNLYEYALEQKMDNFAGRIKKRIKAAVSFDPNQLSILKGPIKLVEEYLTNEHRRQEFDYLFFIQSILKKNLKLIDLFLSHGVSFCIDDENLKSGLVYAIEVELYHEDFWRAATPHLFDIYYKGQPALFYLVRGEFVDLLLYLSDFDFFDINAQTLKGRTLFHIACKENLINVVEPMLMIPTLNIHQLDDKRLEGIHLTTSPSIRQILETY